MKIYDQHIHSYYSEDSTEPLEKYYERALKENIEYVVTCEHFDPHTIISGYTWLADYDALIKEQEYLKTKYPSITPLLGIELGFREEYLDEAISLVNKYEFDIILLSIHDNGIVDYYLDEAFIGKVDEEVRGYFDLMYKAVLTYNNYDVLSHIDYGFKTAKRVDETIDIRSYEDIITKIMKTIIDNGKALEINTKVEESINDDNHVLYLLNLYKSLGGKRVTLSSDAHFVSRYQSSFTRYLTLIKKSGFESLSFYIKRKEYLIKI